MFMILIRHEEYEDTGEVFWDVVYGEAFPTLEAAKKYARELADDLSNTLLVVKAEFALRRVPVAIEQVPLEDL